jgi:hypothetical protein
MANDITDIVRQRIVRIIHDVRLSDGLDKKGWLKVDRFQHSLYCHVGLGAFLKFQQIPMIINSSTTIYTHIQNRCLLQDQQSD